MLEEFTVQQNSLQTLKEKNRRSKHLELVKNITNPVLKIRQYFKKS